MQFGLGQKSAEKLRFQNARFSVSRVTWTKLLVKCLGLMNMAQEACIKEAVNALPVKFGKV